MTLRPRPVRAPRTVIGCWAASVLLGIAVLSVGPHAARPEPRGLGPATVARMWDACERAETDGSGTRSTARHNKKT